MLEEVGGHAVSTREHSVTHGEGPGSRPITPGGYDPSGTTVLAITNAADSPRSKTASELPHASTMPSSLSATAIYSL